MKKLILLSLSLTTLLSGCAFFTDDWQATRKEDIENVKDSCMKGGGQMTISYEISTFSSALRLTCSYPQHSVPELTEQP